MSGPPPSATGSLATPQNRQRSLYNRWAFQHIREPTPTARIPRGDGPGRELPTAERDLTGIRSGTQSGELTIGELPDRTCTDVGLDTDISRCGVSGRRPLTYCSVTIWPW